MKRILVVTGDHTHPDPGKPEGRYSDEDMKAHRLMTEAFTGLFGPACRVTADHDALLDGLREDSPDLVVNFCDTGYRNDIALEHALPAYLEMLGIPYTGAPPATMNICYDKQIVRLIADAAGIDTPREAFLPGLSDGALPSFYPALIKPNCADGSIGITMDSVVRNEDEARAYLNWLRETLPGVDALYQEYLPGPEYGIGLIGNPDTGLRAFPPLVVDFSKLPAGLNPILSYESKTMPESPYWTDIGFKRAELRPNMRDKMIEDCKRLFKRLGLRDYGRFDFRCDTSGRPKLLEVNPNPAWGYDGKLAFMAGFDGVSYADMLGMIVDAAFARIHHA